jgi:glycosyltransferase involved in cell wall biosynthesis
MERIMKFHKLIIFHGGVETLEFFMTQMATTFVKLGYEIFVFDLINCSESIKNLKGFVGGEPAAAVTFNHTGIAGEKLIYSGDKSANIWDELGISVYNIVVDHPFYYHDFLQDSIRPEKYYHISIDRNHMDYIKKYFPQVKNHLFLPLGGTSLVSDRNELKPFRQRNNDIVFTGNYRNPEFFLQFVEEKGQEYIDFYMDIFEDLKANPDKTLEETAYVHVLRETGPVSDKDMRDIYKNMIFLDLMIRFYYRGQVIKTIVDSGHRIRIYGAGWEELECRCLRNITCHGFLTSRECLELIGDSKISVNVMPWFKRGAHDRIFNTMLNGAVCATDTSSYLDGFIKDGENALYYQLKDIDSLPDRISGLLSDSELAEHIAAQGYDTATGGHTWEHRACRLHAFMQGNASKPNNQ